MTLHKYLSLDPDYNDLKSMYFNNTNVKNEFYIWYKLCQSYRFSNYDPNYNILYQRKILEWIRKIVQDDLDEKEQERLFEIARNNFKM